MLNRFMWPPMGVVACRHKPEGSGNATEAEKYIARPITGVHFKIGRQKRFIQIILPSSTCVTVLCIYPTFLRAWPREHSYNQTKEIANELISGHIYRLFDFDARRQNLNGLQVRFVKHYKHKDTMAHIATYYTNYPLLNEMLWIEILFVH
jgi:hypothetical protein